ncbi:MAG: alpha/beta hydrolase-fold protein [Cytophagales bacterium]|nr:alpha/beta hydrolase-fold protein [Cytophagales bacterium]
MKTIAKILFAYTCLFSSLLHAQNKDQSYSPFQSGIKESITSKVLGEQREFWIQVPENAKPYERFPVVYVLDGEEQMTGLMAVHHYYWGHYLPKMILVGIANKQHRDRDLTPSKLKGMETGEAEKFTEFIEKELIPYIDSNYPTTSYRTLIGHSHAGLYTTHVFVNHTDLFSNYIAIDPSLYWDNQKFHKNSIQKLDKLSPAKKTLFISLASPLDRSDESIGIDEVLKTESPHSLLARSTLTFCNAIEYKHFENFRFRWKYYPEDIHGSVPLSTMIDALRFSFAWYQLKDASKFNDPSTSIDTLEAMLNERAMVLTNHFGYPMPPAGEDLLTMGAEMYTYMEQMNKAKLFFGLAAEHYPESETAQRNLADYYHQNNELDKAVKYLTLAYKISGNKTHLEKIEEIKSRD